MKNKLAFLFSLSLISVICTSCKTSEKLDVKILNNYEFHSEAQERFILGRDFENVPFKGTMEESRPLPLSLTFPNEEQEEYQIQISKDKSLSSSFIYKTTGNSFDLYNFENETTYYLKLSTETKESEILSFYNSTSLIRNLYIDGVTNARDISNKTTDTGAKTKQGLIYRGASISGATADGKRTLVRELKIRTDLDLRYDNGEASDSGLMPQYINVPFQYDSSLIDKHQNIRKVFDVFSNKMNYPIYFHCAIGADRTGFFAYLLNGILGVSKEDSLLDYMFSNFGKIGSGRTLSQINFYVNMIDNLNKGSHKENCIEYLVNTCGVPMEQITNIQNILSLN